MSLPSFSNTLKGFEWLTIPEKATAMEFLVGCRRRVSRKQREKAYSMPVKQSLSPFSSNAMWPRTFSRKLIRERMQEATNIFLLTRNRDASDSSEARNQQGVVQSWLRMAPLRTEPGPFIFYWSQPCITAWMSLVRFRILLLVQNRKFYCRHMWLAEQVQPIFDEARVHKTETSKNSPLKRRLASCSSCLRKGNVSVRRYESQAYQSYNFHGGRCWSIVWIIDFNISAALLNTGFRNIYRCKDNFGNQNENSLCLPIAYNYATALLTNLCPSK